MILGALVALAQFEEQAGFADPGSAGRSAELGANGESI
jgi:hypothetical protein